jgi:hypothetical protein
MMFPSRHFSSKICHEGTKNVLGQAFPTNLQKILLIFYLLLKMSQGQSLPDLDPEHINAKSLDFA